MHPASHSPQFHQQFTSAKRKSKIARVSLDNIQDINASNTSINLDRNQSGASKTESKYVYPSIAKSS